jgi:hypothetical protein
MPSSPTRTTSSGEPVGQGDKGGGSPYRQFNIEVATSTRWWHSLTVSSGGGSGVFVQWAGELLWDLMQLGVKGGGVEEV